MDGGDEVERIEIELTAHEPRPRATPEPHPPERADDDRQRPAVSPRGRVAVLVVGVGLGALVVGWVLGSAGGEQTAADAPATTQDAGQDPTDESDQAAATIPPAPVTTTTRPRPTTTTLPPVETTTIEVAPQLADMHYELVGVTQAGRIAGLDLASGTLTVRRGIEMAGGPGFVWAGTGWIVVPSWDSDTGSLLFEGDADPGSLLFEGDADPVAVDIGAPWDLVESETPGHFWRPTDWSPTGPSRVELVDRYGEPLGEAIELPPVQHSTMADPAGGLLVTAPGGTYSLTPEGVSRVVDGRVIAIGAERALAQRCDDRLVCEHVIVDRGTGDVRSVALDEELPQPSPYFWQNDHLGTIGPDGRTAAVGWLNSNGGLTAGLVDLETTEITPLSTAGDQGVRWSPDGRFVFYLAGGRAMARELASGESFLIAEDLAPLNGLAIRPTETEPTD